MRWAPAGTGWEPLRERRRAIYGCSAHGPVVRGFLCPGPGPEITGPCLLVHRIYFLLHGRERAKRRHWCGACAFSLFGPEGSRPFLARTVGALLAVLCHSLWFCGRCLSDAGEVSSYRSVAQKQQRQRAIASLSWWLRSRRRRQLALVYLPNTLLLNCSGRVLQSTKKERAKFSLSTFLLGPCYVKSTTTTTTTSFLRFLYFLLVHHIATYKASELCISIFSPLLIIYSGHCVYLFYIYSSFILSFSLVFRKTHISTHTHTHTHHNV